MFPHLWQQIYLGVFFFGSEHDGQNTGRNQWFNIVGRKMPFERGSNRSRG